ncbi:putative choline transporter, neither null mutation nor overexpression affects choline transport [Actinomortierella ambigua]|nr:putative choline transporter, neither null mutation nor overexpression affects choline transport [Actinomortierella ambigua]
MSNQPYGQNQAYGQTHVQPGYQQPPYYNPQQQQAQWGQQPPQQQYFGAPPPGPTQGQPITGVVPPSYDYERAPLTGAVNPETGLPDKFNPKPKYNDCWAFLLFLVQLAAFVVLSVFAISRVRDDRYNTPSSRQPTVTAGLLSLSGLITMLISVLIGLVFAVLYFFLTQAFPRQVIKVTFAASIIIYLAAAIYWLISGALMPGIFGLIFAVLYAAMWWFWKSRIPFAAAMLVAVTQIAKQYPATFFVAFLGLFVQLVYAVYFNVVLAGAYDMLYDFNRHRTPGSLQVLIIACFFSFYWTSQVIKNVVFCTIAGVYATYYFLAGSPQGMGNSPTCASFKRSCTTSIGSICFGSLIVAIIQTLRAMTAMLRGDGDNGFLVFLACIIDCILGCIQGIAEYVNKYAYCQVAIYGKSFLEAARDTWTILKDRGIEQIINDNLIGNVWAMGAIVGGTLSALGSYLYLIIVKPSFNSGQDFTYIIVVMAFVMGLQMVFTVGTVIDAGTATTFVCLAEDPAALARTKPELFEMIRVTWPAVVQGVRY